MRYLRYTLLTLLTCTVWVGTAFYGGLSGWWMAPIAKTGDTENFFNQAKVIIDGENQGNTAFVLLSHGEVYGSHFASKSQNIDSDTLFPVASASKWITAYAVMTLVDQGKLDLSKPVNSYLSRWQIPESSVGDSSSVTAAQLLSHTSGLGDQLGFGDYSANETVPEIDATLRSPRASSGNDVAIALTTPPGTEWRYSGGGYLILQLLVEEISGQPFADYVTDHVFAPLGMSRSNYAFIETSDNHTLPYNADGTPASHFQYASAGATGLNTSAADLVRFVQANIDPEDFPGALPADKAREMQNPLGKKLGADIWGLGVMLYAPSPKGHALFGHDGSNEPAINAAARINPDNGDAIVLLTNGNPILASRIGNEWTLWQSGYPDFLFFEQAISSAFLPILVGCMLIILLAALMFIKRKKVPL